MEPIILASSSPRRQEILKLLNIPFKVVMPEIDESQPDDVTTEKLPEYLATRKVDAVARSMPAGSELPWILGADTLIELDGKIFGKPHDQEEAVQFLQELQGKTHRVLTGLALYNGTLHFVSTRTVISQVTFAPMTREEIDWYISTGDWHGAAGGYRIQGLASCFIKTITGTNSAVVGLPIFELYDMLKEQGYALIE
ncbi:MAG: Maf family protein [Treponemataceae bacterium]|nr:Maf family protein [Treponemataceae bacterium]MDE6736035.1 Maf family protein [Treponemataceae bacterium]MDE7227190.1 Maf family protein [Treponemataceae bacterium]